MMFAFPLFLLGDGEGVAHGVALAFSIAGLVAGWYAFLLYIPQGLQALREGKVGPGRRIPSPTERSA